MGYKLRRKVGVRVIYGLKKLKKFRKPVVVLGVFDGVHCGHRKILKGAVAKARSIKGTSVVLTFWPHPQRQDNLYSLEHRIKLIGELGMDVCIAIKFTPAFSKISAKDFVKDILIKKVGAHYIYVGKNFRFGRNAVGNLKLLERLSRHYNFKLKVFDVIKINRKPISSTYIRKLITQGKLDNAKRLLLRPVSLLGTVIKGTSLASRLGFPTANIDPHHEVLPPSGVYAVKIVLDDKKLNGICYIGTKPTFRGKHLKNKPKRPKYIEVYIFNFNKNIYGKYLEIQFEKMIRDEKKFASTFALASQIEKDIKTCQKVSSPH